jgi:cytochrome P450
MPLSFGLLDILLFGCVAYFAKLLFTKKSSLPLPPGPKPLPLIGNLLDWPTKRVWETFNKWADSHGDLVYCNLLGKQIIIINSIALANTLLDKKGSNYSERPVLHVASRLVGWNRSIVLAPYGERLRQMRALFARSIGTRAAIAQYIPMEELETRRFLRRLAGQPERLKYHVQKLVAAITLNISYGYQVKEGDDILVELAERVMRDFGEVSLPGNYLVDVFPALEMLPTGFPGTSYRKTAQRMRKSLDEQLRRPYDMVKQQVSAGTAPASYTRTHLIEGLTPEQEDQVMWTASAIYAAGAETAVSTITSFFLIMTLFPEIQARAHAELEGVLGPGVLPTFEDRSRLPYLEALLCEVARWSNIGPQGVPHVVREDDVHEGMLIPKGTMVLVNLWRIIRDPAVYADPLTFNPSRFLGNSPEPDPRPTLFGFGRRVCPGQVLADSMLWVSVALSLAAFEIGRMLDEDGREIIPKAEWEGPLVMQPVDLRCTIKPRSKEVENLLREVPLVPDA